MKTDRLLALILTLLDHRQLSATRLAELFSVSTRTIYRDVETLSLAGIPITTTLGSKGGISILNNYKIDKKTFSPQELSNLLISLNILNSTLDQDVLTKTLIKIKSLMPENHQHTITIQSNQIAIDLSTWRETPSIQLQIKKIKNALNDNSLLNFQYDDRNGQQSSRQVEPYRLLFKEASWYLEAFCLLRNDFRTFKLARMTAFEVTTTLFNPRPFTPTATQKKKEQIPQLITVTLLIAPFLKERILTQFGGSIIGTLPPNLIAIIPFLEEEAGYNMLLGLGAKAQCLEPENIRKELLTRIETLYKIYRE